MSDTRIRIRLDDDTRARVESLAKATGRSVQQETILLIEAALEIRPEERNRLLGLPLDHMLPGGAQ